MLKLFLLILTIDADFYEMHLNSSKEAIHLIPLTVL